MNTTRMRANVVFATVYLIVAVLVTGFFLWASFGEGLGPIFGVIGLLAAVPFAGVSVLRMVSAFDVLKHKKFSGVNKLFHGLHLMVVLAVFAFMWINSNPGYRTTEYVVGVFVLIDVCVQASLFLGKKK